MESPLCIREPTPRENMTSTRIEIAFNQIARVNDASDLAELLFPGNRNQQHTFLVVWFSLKWAPTGLVPNLEEVAREHGVSRRTQERVRAKLRRLGLIDHVSRFNARHGYREGWVFSSRCETSLRQFGDKIGALKNAQHGMQEKDELLIKLAGARRDATSRKTATVIATTSDFETRRRKP